MQSKFYKYRPLAGVFERQLIRAPELVGGGPLIF